MRTAVFLSFLFVLSSAGLATTIYVPDDYTDIQSAIDASANGDTIIVRPGTYVENIDFAGKAITVRSEKGPEVTIIDGNLNGSVVTFQSGETQDSKLIGFTITNGSGTYVEYFLGDLGGGIFIELSCPTILNNIIRDNQASYGGGGICCYKYSDAMIAENLITDNWALSGGGILCRDYSSPTIKNNRVEGNTSNSAGGIYGGDRECCPEICGNIIIANTATDKGGGLRCHNLSDATVVNNLIAMNSSYIGGGIHVKYGSEPIIVNNTVVGNTSVEGGGICCDASDLEVTNNIIWGNVATDGPAISLISGSDFTISYSNVEGGQPLVHVDSGSTIIWGNCMIDADPIFVMPSDNDYHLTWNSPCRDAGNDSYVIEPEDFEGDPRIAYDRVDIGADEFYAHLYYVGDVTPGASGEVRVIGEPNRFVTLLNGDLRDPPIQTRYGVLYLTLPLNETWEFWKTNNDGVFLKSVELSSLWIPGDEYYFQALVGSLGHPAWSLLTNLLVMRVE